MKFIVPIKLLRAASVCQANSDIRYYLNGLHLTEKRIESTNGHVAYIARGEFYHPEWFSTETVKYDVIVKVGGKIPSTTKSKNIQYAIIEDDSDSSVLIRYMDFYGCQVDIGMGKLVDGRFPNIPKLMSNIRKTGKVTDSIGINADYLAMLSQMTKGEKHPLASMETFDSNTAIIFGIRRIELDKIKENFILMPARL